MPTDRRSRPSARPAAARAAGSMAACVIDAGCATRLSTPPSDSASEKNCRPSTKRCTAGDAALEFEGDDRAEARLLALARRRDPDAWAGPGTTPCAPAAASPASAASSWHCGRARPAARCSVRRPRSVRKLSKAEPVRPRQLAHQPSCSCSSFVARDDRATDHVAVAVDVLGGGVQRRGPRPASAAAATPATGRCCRRRLSAPMALARFATSAAMSVMRSSGLLGVSIHTRAAGFAQAPRRARPRREAHEVDLEIAALVPGSEQAVRAAVAVVRRDDARALRNQVAAPA